MFQQDVQKLVQQLVFKSSNPKLIESAFEFAKEAYKERTRINGENYIIHALRVAIMLKRINLDPVTIAFAILHDVLDDVPASIKAAEIEEIEKKFGKEISSLIENISELDKVRYSLSVGIKEKKTFTSEKIENLRKMFLALAGDIRVVLVNLSSRLDGLNYLKFLPEDQRKVQALETLKIFVPVASRLGLSEMRRSLEDVAFYNLFPEKFNWVKKNIIEHYQKRERYLKKFIPHLKKFLRKDGIGFLEINYRVKSYWSTYQKLIRKNMDFEKIHDLVALRIIMPDIPSCYKTLGVIHKYFRPISEEINDYIAKPKANGYRSLHTTVFCEREKIIEMQIRTQEMQKEAEYGICAHWAYKEKIDLQKQGEFFQWTKVDFFKDKVFCFTPKGDIISLPKNSTPIDFAYAVHSEIGNHCESAKINSKITHLNYILQNGDIVEIGINKNKFPSADWLRFVKTSLAKNHIKKLTDKSKSIFNFGLPGFIRKKLIEISEAKKKKKEQEKSAQKQLRQIYIAGQKGMLIHVAKCCSPKPGDKVRAYLAPGRATVLHKTTCSVFKEIYRKFPEKTIDASWE